MEGGKRPGWKLLGGKTTRGGNGLGAKHPGFVGGFGHGAWLSTVLCCQTNNAIVKLSRFGKKSEVCVLLLALSAILQMGKVLLLFLNQRVLKRIKNKISPQ